MREEVKRGIVGNIWEFSRIRTPNVETMAYAFPKCLSSCAVLGATPCNGEKTNPSCWLKLSLQLPTLQFICLGESFNQLPKLPVFADFPDIFQTRLHDVRTYKMMVLAVSGVLD